MSELSETKKYNGNIESCEKNPSLTQSTINLYKANLSRLDKYGIDYKNFSDPVDIINSVCKINDIGSQTVRHYLFAILWYYKTNNISINGLNIFREKINDINKATTEKYDSAKMTDAELNKYLNWDEIVKVYERLYSEHHWSDLAFKRCITIAIYVLTPPRRLKDYSNLICVKNNDDIPPNRNCYVMSEKKFVFCEFKTVKDLGTQIISVPDKLDDLLKKYIAKFNLCGKALLGTSENDLSDKIKRIFTKYGGKGATVNTLRHSYIMHQDHIGNLKTPKERKDLAYAMGHTHTAQQDMYLKIG